MAPGQGFWRRKDPLFVDNFDDTDGVLLENHTPDLNRFSNAPGYVLGHGQSSEHDLNVLKKPATGSWTGSFYHVDTDSRFSYGSKIVLGMKMLPEYDGIAGGTGQTTNSSGVGWNIHYINSNNQYFCRIRWNDVDNWFCMLRRKAGGLTVDNYNIGGDGVTEYAYELLIRPYDESWILYRDGVQVAADPFGVDYGGDYKDSMLFGPYLITRPGGSALPYEYRKFWVASRLMPELY